MNHIKYIKKKTKYRLEEEYHTMTGIVGYEGETHLITLTLVGKLTIRTGYGFDPSGPTIDTDSSLRGSLEHDAFFELMRDGFIPVSEMDTINDRLETVCKEDGMNHTRAELWDLGLDLFGKSSADPKDKPELLIAPGEDKE